MCWFTDDGQRRTSFTLPMHAHASDVGWIVSIRKQRVCWCKRSHNVWAHKEPTFWRKNKKSMHTHANYGSSDPFSCCLACHSLDSVCARERERENDRKGKCLLNPNRVVQGRNKKNSIRTEPRDKGWENERRNKKSQTEKSRITAGWKGRRIAFGVGHSTLLASSPSTR